MQLYNIIWRKSTNFTIFSPNNAVKVHFMEKIWFCKKSIHIIFDINLTAFNNFYIIATIQFLKKHIKFGIIYKHTEKLSNFH